MKFEKNLSTGYLQIFVLGYCNGNSHLDYTWTEKDFDAMLCAKGDFLIIGTGRAFTVPFSLNILEARPNVDFSQFNHIVEAGIDLKSGLHIFGDYPDEAYSICVNLTPGKYGALVCHEGLDTISEDGFDGNDSYHLFLWPVSEPIERRVLKQWSNTKMGS